MAKRSVSGFVLVSWLCSIACSGNDEPKMLDVACTSEVGTSSSPLIDDFEDGDNQLLFTGNRRGAWYATNDGTGIQAPPPDPSGHNPFLLSAPGSPESPRYALRTVGWGFTEWGAYVSVNLNAPLSAPCPYDVSAYSGLKFRAKGSGQLRVTLGTRETTQVADGGECSGDHCSDFGAAVTLTNDWTELSLAFVDLTQPSWAAPAVWTPSDTLRLSYWVEHGDFDYWIDDVQFY